MLEEICTFSNSDCDPPWKGFLPSDVHKIQSTSWKGCLTSQICKIEFTSERILTLTLCQNPASMKIDFHLLKFTEFDPAWKGFFGG